MIASNCLYVHFEVRLLVFTRNMFYVLSQCMFFVNLYMVWYIYGKW